MFVRDKTVFKRNILAKTKNSTIKIHSRFSLYMVMGLFSMIIFSLPIYSDEFPVWFRLKPEVQYGTLGWERRPASSEEGWAEQKIGDGKWDTVPRLRKKVKVGLALAGGVVRGVAHIGVLRALEENYILIDGISGTSMGSIIGGLYASGYSPDSLELIVKKDIDWETFFQDEEPREYTPIWERIRNKPRPPAMDVAFAREFPFISLKVGSGIRIAQKFTDEIAKKTLGACYRSGFDFSKLPHPFGAIIANLNSGKSELKVDGTLSTALRASGSFPMAFEPMSIEGVQYVDGGVLDNLPVDAFLQDFDSVRKPDTIITIHDKEKGEDIFVIASYPSKLRGVRDKARETGEETSGWLGIGVLSKTTTLAREIHVWNSWDNADGKIDMDIQGGFDFNEKKMDELIKAGYSAAMTEIGDIKREIARREDSINPLPLKKPREILRVASVKLYQVKNNDTLKIEEVKEVKRIEKAMRFIPETSRIERNDVCYALRNIYNIGDYKNVGARVDKKKGEFHIKFFLTRKDKYSDSIDVRLRMGEELLNDSLITKKINNSILTKQRKLGFMEIEELVEKEYVNRGYVTPLVDSAKYSSVGGKDSLLIYVNNGKKLTGVKIIIPDSTNFPDTTNLRAELEDKFTKPLSPEKVLKKNKEIYKDFQLRTIAVEGIKEDSLIISARAKTGHTFEFPALSFDKDQGINLFAELRTKRIRGLGNRSFYANYGQNFPVKEAKELIKGHNYNIGVSRCSPMSLSSLGSIFWSIFPDFSLGNKRLTYPSLQDTTLYDMQYDEFLFGSVSWPIYNIKDFALIPGLEFSGRRYLNDSLLDSPVGGFLRLEYDDLDHFIFPTAGAKVSAETEFDIKKSWAKAKIKGTLVKSFRIKNNVKTAFTAELYGSAYQEQTPVTERYSMGGNTPIGSYQLRLYDSEDLPGYRRDEFIEPYMFKVGGSARLTLFEMQTLGLRANIHIIGSFYLASTSSDAFSSLFNENSWFYSPSIGFYLDTSVLNIGAGWQNTPDGIFHDVYLSVVLYGLGF
jgi:predicted acylesterase/phospholipase RssA